MAIEHLTPAASADEVADALARDGCVVVDRVIHPDTVERLRQELDPWLAATPAGRDAFSGHHTRRTGGLIARSQTARELVMHPLVLDTVRAVLEGATSFQLHLTQMIAIGPGEPAQAMHRDQWAFDFFPFPAGYDVQCNTIWAVSDFCERNGATRVVPGSHRLEGPQRFEEGDSEAAEMEAGSVLLYTGSVYHGGGANRSDDARLGLNLTYCRSWLRQEENQYLSVPFEVARELPEPLLRLMGYARGAYALGYVDDLRDPMEVLRPEAARDGFGELSGARQQLRRQRPRER